MVSFRWAKLISEPNQGSGFSDEKKIAFWWGAGLGKKIKQWIYFLKLKLKVNNAFGCASVLVLAWRGPSKHKQERFLADYLNRNWKMASQSRKNKRGTGFSPLKSNNPNRRKKKAENRFFAKIKYLKKTKKKFHLLWKKKYKRVNISKVLVPFIVGKTNLLNEKVFNSKYAIFAIELNLISKIQMDKERNIKL